MLFIFSTPTDHGCSPYSAIQCLNPLPPTILLPKSCIIQACTIGACAMWSIDTISLCQKCHHMIGVSISLPIMASLRFLIVAYSSHVLKPYSKLSMLHTQNLESSQDREAWGQGRLTQSSFGCLIHSQGFIQRVGCPGISHP